MHFWLLQKYKNIYKNIPQRLEIGFVVQSHIYTYTYIIWLYMYVYILIVLKEKQTNIFYIFIFMGLFLASLAKFKPIWWQQVKLKKKSIRNRERDKRNMRKEYKV